MGVQQSIFRFLLTLLAITGIACQTSGRTDARAPQLYWPRTKAYQARASHFRLSEDESKEHLKSHGIPGLGLHMIVGDWYFHSFRPPGPDFSFGGYYVNGITGAIEGRVYRGETVRYGKQPREELRWETVEVIAPPMPPREFAKFKARHAW